MRKLMFNIRNEESGAVALIIALAMSAVLGMLLLTVDLGQQQTQKFNTQGAADSSVLVAAQIVSELRIKNGNNNNPPIGVIRPKVVEAFKANSKVAGDNDKQAQLDEDSVEVSYLTSSGRNYPDRIRVDGCFITNDKFNVAPTQDGSKTEHRVCSFAVANLAVFGNAEIVFALDVSASMNKPAPGGTERRIELLRDAVDTTVTDLINAYAGGVGDVLPETYWGVVPFRGMVDLGNEYSHFVSEDAPVRDALRDADENLAICTGGDCSYNADNSTPKNGGIGRYSFTDANLLRLKRIPLTAREGEDPKAFIAGSSTDDFNDNNKFLSYGSHPWDYWMGWEKEACCGFCKKYLEIAPYNTGIYEDDATCSGTRCGCGGGDGDSGGGSGSSGGPGAIGGGSGVGGGAG
jgi:hypothetical protein